MEGAQEVPGEQGSSRRSLPAERDWLSQGWAGVRDMAGEDVLGALETEWRTLDMEVHKSILTEPGGNRVVSQLPDWLIRSAWHRARHKEGSQDGW